MAIESLKKIYLIGHGTLEESIVTKLHTLGIMQITDARDTFSEMNNDLLSSEASTFKKPSETLNQLQYIIKYIQKYVPRKGFLSELAKGKVILSRSEFIEILNSFNIYEVYLRIRNLEESIHEVNNKKAILKVQLHELTPWLVLDVNLADISSTEKVAIIPGMIKERNFNKFKEEISALTEYSHIQEIYTQMRVKYCILLYLNDSSDGLAEIFRKYEFKEIFYPKLRFTPQRISKRIKQELKFIDKKYQTLQEESKELAEYYIKSISLYDYYEQIRIRQEARNYLVRTKEAFCLSGWIITQEADKVKQKLEAEFKELEILITEPGKDEQVPIILKNRELVKPFEVITNLYGQPCYYELDPTPYLAPFFFLFWGMCITDAGYGIIMMISSYIMIKKFKLQEMGKRFLNLIFLGGIASILWGILVGGWFGINLDRLPPVFNVLKSMRLLDPLKNPLTFFIIALSLGFIQVFSGIAVKMYENIRLKKFKEAFLDELSWLVLLVGILVIGLGKSGVISNIVAKPFIFLTIAGALTIVLFKGRNAKNIFSRIFIGIFSLLGLFGFSGAVSYFSDIVSYARLFALGLATGALAQAINAAAKATFSIGFWFGVVVAPLIIVVFHPLNIAINAFGGFIHSVRLQYVEFFTKFFEGGGKVFSPFREQRKYTIIK